ncbi:MAG: LPS export ABC transporter periplasmic protein LptC [Shewanella sp.]|nr:LPS export ABC transporter periplasmic protein LptC [Shewanella sp.]MCF1429373.1 LPS export ABC transporter periplasmic protein LptC [Shewanella sp.]MCF1438616.1 LPS export ABC transporter periplasmic protein LptC [Shewanella sp.]MCF1456055.1 LPS export ABC transporter periplasmic protein LptC [Shewanella sp.]
MNRITLAIVLFFSIALGLYWQVQMKKNEQQVNAASNVVQPDFVADDLYSVSFNDRGEVESRVMAVYMEHFDASNLTRFSQPVYLLYPDNGQANWRISAAKGTLKQDDNIVTLENNVIIDAITPNEPLQQLKTSYLQLDLDTMIMRSDRVIQVNGSNFKAEGTGLYANLNAQTVELLNQVTGIYEPN